MRDVFIHFPMFSMKILAFADLSHYVFALKLETYKLILSPRLEGWGKVETPDSKLEHLIKI